MTDRSSIPADDWLPVQQALLRGLNHALSNRLASLSALTILLEGSSRVDPPMQQALSDDVARLGGLLDLFRALPGPTVVRREGVRFGDALRRAGALLAHHPECSDLEIAPVLEDADAPPVSLVGADAVRASALLMLAMAHGASRPTSLVVTARARGDGWLTVGAERVGASCALISTGAEHGALERFAAVEGGQLRCAPGEASESATRLTLELPGLWVPRP